MANEVRHNEARSRYEILADGELAGVADYAVRGDVVVLPHTEIDRARRGHGLGAELVQFALDDIRSSGRSVVPACWFVAQFVDENPGYRDLVA
jgi:uncharacterized protein